MFQGTQMPQKFDEMNIIYAYALTFPLITCRVIISCVKARQIRSYKTRICNY